MMCLKALESELKQAGIPSRRRSRIINEFADHLHENPDADLGEPRLLARQFADVLGTRLARSTAYWASGILGIGAVVLVVMFLDGGRTWGGWFGYGSHPHSAYMPSWWTPLMVIWFISAQVTVAAGALALLRAWRLRYESVIVADEARVLRRRAAVGLTAGAVTMLILPATDLMLARPLGSQLPSWHSLVAVLSPQWSWWGYVAIIGGPLLALAMVMMLRVVLVAARMSPQREGDAGDLAVDLGTQRCPLTPGHLMLMISVALVVVMLLVGIHSGEPLAGLARGLVDAVIAMASFVVLGAYLGVRTTSRG